MEIIKSAVNYRTNQELERDCYLVTNGLGGYSSLTLAGSLTRNDHSFFMAALVAPNHRCHIVRKVDECVHVNNKHIPLTSQSYVNSSKDMDAQFAFSTFSQKYLPVFIYDVAGIQIKKTIVMVHHENTIGIQYEIYNPHQIKGSLFVTPKYLFQDKGVEISPVDIVRNKDLITSGNLTVYYRHNGQDLETTPIIENDLLFNYDVRDGRDAIGQQVSVHQIEMDLLKDTYYLIYHLKPNNQSIDEMIENEINRQKTLVNQIQTNHSLVKQLVRASDQFVVYRESTKSTSIIAGYPFFGDWGRDTMIAMLGCTITTKQFEQARQIFRTFIKYERRGIIPNIFPEHGNEPRYNTIDASLLFIVSIYHYYMESQDMEFIQNECLPTIENIIHYYKEGTDFNIHMDVNGLISGGRELEQLTWMDVCVAGQLPTPRHGYPVEINALWYNSLKIYEFFLNQINSDAKHIASLALKVKQSFNDVFINADGYLSDVIEPSGANNQIRPNQLYALGLPFTLVDKQHAKSIISIIEQKLLTTLGLRTLNIEDQQFKPQHTGSLITRDFAYHQGTVWPFMIGQYAFAIMNYYDDDPIKLSQLKERLNQYQSSLYEGCIGQIAEIYDGYIPNQSRGCFAQAWSISEVLRSIVALERMIS